MKEFKYTYNDNNESETPKDIDFRVADWRDPTNEVLDLIDDLLNKYDLEIAIMETVGDFYEFGVRKKS